MKVLDIFEKGKNLLEAEKEVLDFTHAEIGAWLAEKWNLPEGVLETILYHHNPSAAKKHLKRVAVIHIADYIVSKGIFSVIKGNPGYPLDLSSLNILGISENNLIEMGEKMSTGKVF